MTSQIAQYGVPDDAREWRQFLVLRPCPADPDPSTQKKNRAAVLPCVLWVQPRKTPCHFCGGPVYTIHPASARAFAEASGEPLAVPAPSYHVCSSEGEFIE